MTDPNLIRWLYRFGDPSDRHVAVFVRQGSPEQDVAVRGQLEETTRRRWRRCGVTSYFAEYYGEVAQLLHEAGLLKAGLAKPSFRTRAAARYDSARIALAPDDPHRFAAAQAEASEWLRGLLETIRKMAAADAAGLDGESLGLALWGVDHDRGQVTLWVAHDRVFSGGAVLESRPLERDSRWVAVAAVTAGAPVEQDPAVYTTRWRTIRGIPIVVVDEDGDGRTVSGAFTLTSTTPLAESKIGSDNAPEGLLHAIDSFLAERGAHWFS